jgi:hypothetical protein
MMRKRTSGQAAFLTAQLSSKRKCQNHKKAGRRSRSIAAASRRQHELLTATKTKTKKKKTEKDRPWEDHCNNKKNR